ncbi:hypothetical protein D3C78_1525940 [compost metagenome]
MSVDCRAQLGLDRQLNIGNRRRLASTSSVKGTFAFQCVRSCRFIHIVLVRCESTAVIRILFEYELVGSRHHMPAVGYQIASADRDGKYQFFTAVSIPDVINVGIKKVRIVFTVYGVSK